MSHSLKFPAQKSTGIAPQREKHQRFTAGGCPMGTHGRLFWPFLGLLGVFLGFSQATSGGFLGRGRRNGPPADPPARRRALRDPSTRPRPAPRRRRRAPGRRPRPLNRVGRPPGAAGRPSRPRRTPRTRPRRPPGRRPRPPKSRRPAPGPPRDAPGPPKPPGGPPGGGS